MKKFIARILDEVWYKDCFIGTWLMPFSMVFIDVSRFRRYLYKKGYKTVTQLPVPVVIVGNLTVGGAGKTPLVIYLVEQLQAAGFHPGVVSRGYGGKSEAVTQRVTQQSDADLIGDEPLLIAQRTRCPVAVGAVRAEAAQLLIENNQCDVIVSDDGLQHYALHRDIEVLVIDGVRRFGNNFCLPSGPLREPQERMRDVDFIVCNGGSEREEGEILMQLQGDVAINMHTQERKRLSDFNGQQCHAFAGIGYPQRFFDLLKEQGLSCQTHPFPDHYRYTQKEIQFNSADAIFMTEKDAVKCMKIATEKHWYVPVEAVLEQKFIEAFVALLKKKTKVA